MDLRKLTLISVRRYIIYMGFAMFAVALANWRDSASLVHYAWIVFFLCPGVSIRKCIGTMIALGVRVMWQCRSGFVPLARSKWIGC